MSPSRAKPPNGNRLPAGAVGANDAGRSRSATRTTNSTGYVAVDARALQPTGGLRTATVVLFWCTVAATGLLALAAWNRRSVWNDFHDGSKSVVDVDDADALLGTAVGLQLGLALASTIVLSIWSLRSARRAQVRGARDLSPGLACGAWYIPFAWFIVPFVQLRRVVSHARRSAAAVNWWQGLFIAGWVSFALSPVGNPEDADSADDVAGGLTLQTAGAALATVLLAMAAVAATRALRDIDNA